MKFLNIPMLSLQLFAEGGAAAGDGGTAQGTGVEASAAGMQTKGAKNPLASVVYGKQEAAPAAEVQKGPDNAADPAAEFEALIKGKYKEQYDARMQDTIRSRLKAKDTQITELTQKQTALEPVLEVLFRKHGVEDVAALAKAIEEDDSYWEQEALEKGMNVQQLKNFKKMEKENASLRKQMEQQKQQQNADQMYGRWMQQAEEAKKVYNGFDLKNEMQNPQFQRLISNGIDVRTAYEVIHKDEIIPAAMQFAAKTVETKLAQSIASGAGRPAENGVGSGSPSITKSDVSQLSKADRQEIIRRVQRGEKIRF